jgi:hypothetical protein
LTPSTDGSQSAPLPAGHSSAAPAPAGFDRRRALERAEHEADIRRLVFIFKIGVVVWPAYGLLDWIVVRFHQAGELSYYWSLRLAGWAVLAGALWRLLRPPPPSPRVFRILDLSTFSILIALITLMSLPYGGIASPYAAGISVVLVGRGVVLASRWRRGIVSIAVPALTYPLVLLAAYTLAPGLVPRVLDAPTLATFAENLFFVAGTSLLLVYGGHTAWRLRRQVFEARSIGKYELRRRIGRGGMGEVWAAYHAGLRREIALKILRPGGEVNPAAIARFEREVKATSELTHPNTVRVFDCGTTEDGVWFYAMELLEGVDLHTLVARDGALPSGRAAHLVWQASRALAEAHARGIVHRDLKPGNLFITAPGGEADFVKVLDFGVAKVLHEGRDLTQEGRVAGTPAYMAPEMARGLPADARTDVYALGACLYFALLGRPPFVRETTADLLYAHVHEALVPPSRLGLALAPELEAIVVRCLEKEPARRFVSASELASVLGQCLPLLSRGDGRSAASADTQKVAQPTTERGQVSRDDTFTRTQIS